MANVDLPLSITYETEGVTPIADVIAALRAVEEITEDAASLLPSLIDGLKVENVSLNVKSLTQNSPLRELFLISLVIAFQPQLKEEVPPLLEELFKVNIPDQYDTLVTVVFMTVVFYGVGLATDLAGSAFRNVKTKKLLADLIAEVANSTDKTPDEIEAILRAKFDKPNLIKRLVHYSTSFFRPSQVGGNAPVVFDRKKIDREHIRELPPVDAVDTPQDFEKYETFTNINLDIHAQDKDKQNSGWAAIAEGVTDKRLKMKVMSPLEPSQLWGRDKIVGDIVLISKLSGEIYSPTEIHLIGLRD